MATGRRGVTITASGRYHARIYVCRKPVDLGTFDTIEQAAGAYDEYVRANLSSKGIDPRLHFPKPGESGFDKPRPTVCEDCGVTVFKEHRKRCNDGMIRCRSCKAARHNKAWRPKMADKCRSDMTYREKRLSYQRVANYRRRYGMDLADYENLLQRQGGACAVCRKVPSERLVVDHDHESGVVRGLLCQNCNRALGLLQEDAGTVRAATYYLMRTAKPRCSWDFYFMQIATLVATRSKDPSTQVGAVLVRDKTILSTGYNGFPRGVDDTVQARFERPLKYTWTVHAEENCLLSSARFGSKTLGAVLYVTPLFPCARCATSIVQAGVSQVVTSDATRDNPRWQSEFEQSIEIFKEAGVVVKLPD